MTKTLKISKTALRQKGWWLFVSILGLQLLFVLASYWMQTL